MYRLFPCREQIPKARKECSILSLFIKIIKNSGKYQWKMDSQYRLTHSKSVSSIHIPMMVHIQNGPCHFCYMKNYHS